MTSTQPTTRRLNQRYLLTVVVSFARTPDGRVWLDALWWHDLRAHLDYLDDITVVAPFEEIAAPEPGMVEAVAPDRGRLAFVGLLPNAGTKKTLLHLPRAFWRAWKLVGQADLVHSGVAGWPIPIGVVINPVAFIRRKPLIIVVESAFWRLQQDQVHGWKSRLRAWLNEQFARLSLRKATLAVYTHRGYQQSLPVGPRGTGVVLPASWISDRDIVSLEEANRAWDQKPAQPRFLLASRLERQKGIGLFLDALHCLERNAEPVEIDVIGSGAMRPEVEAFANSARFVKMRVLEPVPYGQPFLQLLRGYHGAVIPLTGDEQPRILYDAFSQAVPVIASNTAGNREVAVDGETGFLPEPTPEAFAGVLASCSRQPASLRAMGLRALNVAAGHTHANMHGKRAEVLFNMFGPGAAG
jgi:glycosyltransferase involved in cell wall biosynthesis